MSFISRAGAKVNLPTSNKALSLKSAYKSPTAEVTLKPLAISLRVVEPTIVSAAFDSNGDRAMVNMTMSLPARVRSATTTCAEVAIVTDPATVKEVAGALSGCTVTAKGTVVTLLLSTNTSMTAGESLS